MRIEALSTLVAVVWLTAVLCPRFIAANNLTISFSQIPREESFKRHLSRRAVPLEESMNRPMTVREMQIILHREGGKDGHAVDCCPTVQEMSEPIGGRNRDDMYVQLYRDGDIAQRFYEYSCRPDVLEKPCRFVDRKLNYLSRCVQMFTYVYAIVENPRLERKVESEEERRREEHRKNEHRKNEHRKIERIDEYPIPAIPGNNRSSRWSLDYIKVRNGCSCEIMTKPKKKKTTTKARKVKSKQRQWKNHEYDSET